jgi:hypothetical protein
MLMNKPFVLCLFLGFIPALAGAESPARPYILILMAAAFR